MSIKIGQIYKCKVDGRSLSHTIDNIYNFDEDEYYVVYNIRPNGEVELYQMLFDIKDGVTYGRGNSGKIFYISPKMKPYRISSDVLQDIKFFELNHSISEKRVKEYVKKMKTSSKLKEEKKFEISEQELNIMILESYNLILSEQTTLDTNESNGLWHNIHKKRKRGEPPAKPGDDSYPDKKQWDKLTKESEHTCMCEYKLFEGICEDDNSTCEIEVYKTDKQPLEEAEYKGKNVTLNKPMRGDVKKYKVYVKNDKGNVIKLNFGSPDMEIKRDDPERKKSFRARHKCDTAKDKTTPRYWSCKMWGNKPVSDILKGK